MQGDFVMGFSGKKADICKVEAAYHERIDDPYGYLETEKTEGLDSMPDDAFVQFIVRTNMSININVVRFEGGLFHQIIEKVPEVEAGCWYASLDTEHYFRTYMYSKAGSTKCREWDDTISERGGVIVFMRKGYEDPVVKLLFELYRKKPYNDNCTPAEPGSEAWKNWDYKKLPRTFEYTGTQYKYDDGKILYGEYYELSPSEFDELGYEDQDMNVADEFENDGYMGWGLEEKRSFWVLPDYLERLFTLS